MQCPFCGNQLRETARFCNNCGKVVAGAPPAGMVAQTSAPGDSPGASAQPVPATQPIVGEDEATGAAAEAPGSAPVAAAPAAPTAPAGGAAGEQSAGALLPNEAGVGASGRLDDRLPWPLPPSIIMDGRYRVEALLQSSDEANTYRVTDLRGYERCWVCGQVYGAGAATDRFCRECGADMLARDLLMHERRLADGEAVEGEAAADASAAPAAGDDTPADLPRQFAQNGRMYVVEPKVAQGQAFPRGARLVAGAATDAGRGRAGDHNEDSAVTLIVDRFHEDVAQPLGLFAVADGMGGHASGHRASRLVANVLTHTVLRQLAMPLLGAPADLPLDEDVVATLLRDAVKAANNSLCAANHEADLDAGSTLVAALVAGETAHIANVGDSRCYAYDAEVGLRRITSDHSLVQQLVVGGMIQPDDVYTHPERNKVFRSMGDDPDLAVDLFVQQLKPGTRLLLCCDGGWEMVRDPQIEQILREAPDPQAAADALVVAANDGGGDDNITVIVVEAR